MRLLSGAFHMCQDPYSTRATSSNSLLSILCCVVCYTGVPAARSWGLLSAAEALLPCAGLPGRVAARLAQAAPAADAGADAACLRSGSVTSQALQTQVGFIWS